jgi:ATP-dependent helicase/nuclease subunit A
VQKKAKYIAPDAEVLCFLAAQRLAWQDFEEEDGLVLMDYKTDRVSEAEELVKRYHTQLEYYAQALERLTHKKVKEKLIYSFALHKVIAVD